IYDVGKFVNGLDGVVKVVRELPDSVSIQDFEVVRVPNRVTEEHIAENVEPVFRKSGNIRVATYFPSVNMRKTMQKSGSDSLTCLDTVIYLTQSRWDDSLEVLKDIFPKTYTKESVMPAEKKSKFLESEDSEFEKVIDFHLCSRSDVFVPAISGLFYANVAGKRIASSKIQILVPAEIPGSSSPITSHFSPYISKRNHIAYTCFC
ncbi:Protein MANNAN SYNTHESIS-RELATED 2, partial [Linum perenne]